MQGRQERPHVRESYLASGLGGQAELVEVLESPGERRWHSLTLMALASVPASGGGLAATDWNSRCWSSGGSRSTPNWFRADCGEEVEKLEGDEEQREQDGGLCLLARARGAILGAPRGLAMAASISGQGGQHPLQGWQSLKSASLLLLLLILLLLPDGTALSP